MFTTTATAPAAVQKTFRGLGDQPRLLAQSMMARPRTHSTIETYMLTVVTSLGSVGPPRLRATDVSGRITGGEAEVGLGSELAHRPLKATPTRPRALSSTAGNG